MKVLKPKKVVKSVEETTPAKEEKKSKQKRVVEDEDYPDLLDKKELVLGETNKLVFSVARGGEFGLPMIDIRHYTKTSKYSGPTKKGIRLPLEMLYSLMEILEEIDTECDEKGIVD